MSKSKILFLDIETFPNVAYVWGKYQQDVIRFKQETCIATYAAKWLGKPVFAKALPDYEHYVAGSYDDRDLVLDIHKLLDAADIVVAHNGDNFDIRVCKARFIFHDLKPTAPFKSVDTKKVAKRVARFNSNRLDDLGFQLMGDRKIKTDFDLWKGCIDGDKKSWAQMVKYNKKDVVLLERLYLRLLPWMSTHPNRGLLEKAVCPKCASSDVQYRGFSITGARRYQRFQCSSCGGWGRLSKSVSAVTTINQAD
jgi:DNA polymerase elongation subunit (family B)